MEKEGDTMSEQVFARRTELEVLFGGVNITKDMKPYLLSLDYTDNEEDETDDLQIELQDRQNLWLCQWLNDIVDAAAGEHLSMDVTIIQKDWMGKGERRLPCGTFELDSIQAGGPPSTLSLSGTSLPFASSIRQTMKSKAWENYTLYGIAAEIAGSAGMALLYETNMNPLYQRIEQVTTSDIAFLSDLCHDAGLSLKATGNTLVLFDQGNYEGKQSVFTFQKGGGTYLDYTLKRGTADSQYTSCRVSYVDKTGMCIESIATVENYEEGAENNQQLEVYAQVTSVEEAAVMAQKQLRLHNKFAKTASFTIVGNPSLVAGVTVTLDGFGGWDGKYIIKQAKHSVSDSGYTTKLELRKCLEGY